MLSHYSPGSLFMHQTIHQQSSTTWVSAITLLFLKAIWVPLFANMKNMTWKCNFTKWKNSSVKAWLDKTTKNYASVNLPGGINPPQFSGPKQHVNSESFLLPSVRLTAHLTTTNDNLMIGKYSEGTTHLTRITDTKLWFLHYLTPLLINTGSNQRQWPCSTIFWLSQIGGNITSLWASVSESAPQDVLWFTIISMLAAPW